ncbi:hypothetical protein OV079_27405 [Nannocystis pusilla]|uniref:YtkA-like domain-containing protein n=1 Tax=Nannocystis pusilla TaxID=889268 RepID=A0A9X3ERY4_9BACT|nr:hypothetical protein [Nannocystis pusilla]MCY1009227.1 hypothetical protein [Nannocystis pusilla]
MLIRSAFCLLLGTFSWDCNPDTDKEPFTRPDVPVDTVNGYFEVEVAPEEGTDWPPWGKGPTTLAADVRPGPDPAPTDDPWILARLPVEPPYTLEVRAPVREADGRTAPPPAATSLDDDGRHWQLDGLDLSAPGVWSIEVELRSDGGLVDTVELRFEVE